MVAIVRELAGSALDTAKWVHRYVSVTTGGRFQANRQTTEQRRGRIIIIINPNSAVFFKLRDFDWLLGLCERVSIDQFGHTTRGSCT